MDKKDYIALSERFRPNRFRLIFIAESPPVGDKYFYNPDGEITEPLFAAMMKCVLDLKPEDKLEGLQKFQEKGYYLLDATYTPVNKGFKRKKRNQIILNDYDSLKAELLRIDSNKSIPVILIKKNICELLKPILRGDGFKVLNREEIIPFPSHGWQKVFCERIKKILPRIN